MPLVSTVETTDDTQKQLTELGRFSQTKMNVKPSRDRESAIGLEEHSLSNHQGVEVVGYLITKALCRSFIPSLLSSSIEAI